MNEKSVKFLIMIKFQKKGLIVFVSVVLTDSVFKMGKNCYIQLFLEECKYILREKEATKHITENIEILSNDSD